MASVKRKELERQLSTVHRLLDEKQKRLVEIQGPLRSKTGQLGAIRARMGETKTTIRSLDRARDSIPAEVAAITAKLDTKQMRINELIKDIEYKDKTKLENHIKQLDNTYQSSKLSLKDERHIVAYIDKLKRSRKKVDEFVLLETDMAALKESRSLLHKKKNKTSQDIRHHRKEIDRMHQEYKLLHREAETIQFDLTQLYQQKRKLLEENEANRRLYVEDMQKKPRRLEESKKAEEPDEGNDFELFAEEKRLCRKLITYLELYLIVDDEELADSDVPSLNYCSSGDSQAGLDNMLSVSGSLRRLDLAEGTSVSPNRQRKKNSKRDKRKATQPVPHTPEIFADFARLEIGPPYTYADVSLIIARVTEELHYLDQQSSLTMDTESIDGTYLSSESGMTDSLLNSFELSQSDMSCVSLCSSRMQSSLAEEPWDPTPVRETHSCADFCTMPSRETAACESEMTGDTSTDVPDGIGRSASDSNVQRRLVLNIGDSEVKDASIKSSPFGSLQKISGDERSGDEGIEVGPVESKSSSVESGKGPSAETFLVVRVHADTTEDQFVDVDMVAVEEESETKEDSVTRL